MDNVVPHQKEIEAIEQLTTDEITKLKVWQVLALAIPEGEVYEVANNYRVTAARIYSWRVNPEVFGDDGEEKVADPNGRRGIAHWFSLFVGAVNSRFPPGARLLLQWQSLQLAELQAIQGHKDMLAILQVVDEADEIIREAQALEAKVRAMKAKVAAAANRVALGRT